MAYGTTRAARSRIRSSTSSSSSVLLNAAETSPSASANNRCSPFPSSSLVGNDGSSTVNTFHVKGLMSRLVVRKRPLPTTACPPKCLTIRPTRTFEYSLVVQAVRWDQMPSHVHCCVPAVESRGVEDRVRRMGAFVAQGSVQRFGVAPQRNDLPETVPAQQIGLDEPMWLFAHNEVRPSTEHVMGICLSDFSLGNGIDHIHLL